MRILSMASGRPVERRWSWLASEQGARLLEAVEKDGSSRIARGIRMQGDGCAIRAPGAPGGGQKLSVQYRDWNYVIHRLSKKSAKKKQA